MARSLILCLCFFTGSYFIIWLKLIVTFNTQNQQHPIDNRLINNGLTKEVIKAQIIRANEP